VNLHYANAGLIGPSEQHRKKVATYLLAAGFKTSGDAANYAAL